MIKHTPTPWSINRINQGKDIQIDSDKLHVCSIVRYGMAVGLHEEANARYIVKAVNCHDDLLTALRLAVHAINRKPNFAVYCENKNIKNSYAIAAICDKAIAKAESEG